MTFTSNGQSVLYNNLEIYKAPSPISQHYEFGDKILFIYDVLEIWNDTASSEEVMRNVVMMNKNGNILWRIENDIENPVIWRSIYPYKDKWFVDEYGDEVFRINLENGEISYSHTGRFGTGTPQEHKLN